MSANVDEVARAVESKQQKASQCEVLPNLNAINFYTLTKNNFTRIDLSALSRSCCDSGCLGWRSLNWSTYWSGAAFGRKTWPGLGAGKDRVLWNSQKRWLIWPAFIYSSQSAVRLWLLGLFFLSVLTLYLPISIQKQLHTYNHLSVSLGSPSNQNASIHN